MLSNLIPLISVVTSLQLVLFARQAGRLLLLLVLMCYISVAFCCLYLIAARGSYVYL